MRKQAIVLILTITFTLVICGAVSATSYSDIYVSTTGSDSYDGGDPLHPAQTIDHALEVTQDSGSTVHLANGVYSGTGNTKITIDKSMTIKGESKTGTIINGEDNGRIFDITSGINVEIINVTLTNGNENTGGAIRNNGDLTVRDSAFTGNKGNVGGIFNCAGASLTAINCDFTDNTGNSRGGALLNYGTMTVTGCKFTGNHATDGGAICNYNTGTLTITDSTFTNNDANYGGAIWNTAYMTATGSIFNHNSATDSSGAIFNDAGTVTAHYNRIVGNTAPEGSAIYNYYGEDSGIFDARYNWWGSNNPDFNSIISGTVDHTPWLYLTFGVSPNTAPQGSTSTLTASFNNLFDGTTLTTLNPSIGHIPDGSPVTFTTTLGEVGSKSVVKYTVNGIATAILRADEGAGDALVGAYIDGQTPLNGTVTITATDDAPGAGTSTVNAASSTSRTIEMQDTGAPIVPLALAVLMVLGGLASTRRK